MNLKKLTAIKGTYFFLTLYFLTLPFSIKTIIFSPAIFFSGKFNPYLTSFIYLSDIFLLISFILFGFSLIKHKQPLKLGNNILFLTLILIFIFSQFSQIINNNGFINFIPTFRLLEGIIFYLLIINSEEKINHFKILLILTFSFQSFLSIIQYIKQGSLSLQFLGESILSPENLGIAKINILQQQYVRGYGTLPHPNILGGLLTIMFFLTLTLKEPIRKIKIPLLIIQFIGILSTFSRSALITFLICLIIYYFKVLPPSINLKKYKYVILTPLIILCLIIALYSPLQTRFLHLPTGAEIKERILYYQISIEMMIKHPLGIGLNTFTQNMQNYSDIKLLPWEYQPVHNIFFLLSNEIGIIGGLLLIFLLLYGLKKLAISQKKLLPLIIKSNNNIYFICLLSVIILGSFDHYFITNYQAQSILFFILAVTSNSLHKSTTVIKKLV